MILKFFKEKTIFVENEDVVRQQHFIDSVCLIELLKGQLHQGWASQSGDLKEPEREIHTHRVRRSTGGRRDVRRQDKQEGEGGRWEQSVKGPRNVSTEQSPQLLCLACRHASTATTALTQQGRESPLSPVLREETTHHSFLMNQHRYQTVL